MPDARIAKTKKKLYKGLFAALEDKSFEEVTVTNICAASGVTRITFYSYYRDKYTFVNDMFEDIYRSIAERFRERQEAENPGEDPRKSCHILLNTILDYQIDESLLGLMAKSDSRNAYIVFSFYWYILKEAGPLAQKYFEQMNLSSPENISAVFTITGIAACVRDAVANGRPVGEIKEEANRLLDRIIDSRTSSGDVRKTFSGKAPEYAAEKATGKAV